MNLKSSIPTIGLVSLGCPKALVDSERILTQLRAEGYRISPDYEGADAIIISNANGIFALTGRIIDFPYLENKLAPVAATLVEETVEEEGMDFGML